MHMGVGRGQEGLGPLDFENLSKEKLFSKFRLG